MASQFITIHVGQCGNSIGMEFWKNLCEEHGIAKDGSLAQPTEKTSKDYKDAFFYQADDDRYIPRSVLIDLEPRVIHNILVSDYGKLYNQENVFSGPEGSGAGNAWTRGYRSGKTYEEEIFNILDREVENADNLEGFILTHSISGGTGSGLGSFLTEHINEKYPKKLLHTYSVFSEEKDSTVIVAPYNSILTLRHLIEHPDLVSIVDNTALFRLSQDRFRRSAPELSHAISQATNYEHQNKLISKVMTSSCGTFRFPGPTYATMASIITQLNPFPPLHFIQSAYTPLTAPSPDFIQKTSVQDVLQRLVHPTSMMVSTKPDPSKKHCLLSGLAILQGDFTFTDLSNALDKLERRKAFRYPPWSPLPLEVTSCSRSPHIKHHTRVSGLLLANHTNISTLFDRVIDTFNMLRKKKAFLFQNDEEYFPDILGFMDDSKMKVEELCQEYLQATKADFVPIPDFTFEEKECLE